MERIELRREELTVHSYNTYHIFNIFPVRYRVNVYFQGIFRCHLVSSLKKVWCTFLYVQDYKRTYDIINIYKLNKVKVRESSSHCYCLRAVSGFDLIPPRPQ